MKNSKEPLDVKCVVCLAVVVLVVLIFEPAILLLAGFFLVALFTQDGKSAKGRKMVDWDADDTINKPQWSDSTSYSSSSGSGGINGDLVSNPAYSHLSYNIHHRP